MLVEAIRCKFGCRLECQQTFLDVKKGESKFRSDRSYVVWVLGQPHEHVKGVISAIISDKYERMKDVVIVQV